MNKMNDSISAVILTKNEEKNIADCIKSLAFSSEIIVVDDNSTDKTVEIAKKHNTRVFERKLNGDFASQRNFGLMQAKGEWVLFVDADERVSKKLSEEILRLPFDSNRVAQDDKNPSAYCLRRRDFWWGRELKHGEVQKARNQGIVRLVRKGSGIFMGNVHEAFHTAKHVGNLQGYLDHYPHPTVKDFLEDINEYSTIRAQELFNRGIHTNVFQITLFPTGKFMLNYFLYGGFLDGPAGFAYAFFMSFHSFLVRAKLYQLYHNVD